MIRKPRLLLCWLLVTSTMLSSGIVASADELPGVSLNNGPYADKIVYNVISQDDQQVLALQEDEIDLIGDMIDPIFLETLTEAQDIDVANVLRNGYGYMTINTAKYPLNITDFRRALAFAVDKEAISDDVWAGLSVPQDSCVPQINPFSIEGQLDYTYYEANVALGNDLLDAAGFDDIDEDGIREAPDGSKFDVLIECAQSSNIAIECGEFFANALIALGIDATSQPTDFYEYLNRLYFHGDFDVVFLGESYNNFDVDWLAYRYWSEYADEPYWNYPNWENDTYDSWRDQLLHSTNYDDVYEAAIEMQKIWVHACPEIICYENVLLSAYRTDRFEGFINDVSEGIPGWWTNYKVHLKNELGGPYGGTLRWSTPLDIDSFNFMVSSSAYAEDIWKMMYDSLIKVDYDGNDIPWLGESYKIEYNDDNPSVPDGYTRITFDLIQNATWSDNTPLTAEDAAFTLNYYRDSPGNPYGNDIAEMTAAYAPSPYTLVVEFSAESYWYLHNIGYKPIIPKHIFADIGLDEWNIWNPDYDELVTSGPFFISDYVPGEFCELTYNSDYFYGFNRDYPPGSDITITPQTDLMFEYGTTGNTLTWWVSSTSEYNYEIYQDSTLIEADSGTASSITISVDGLEIGVYNYTLVVYTDAMSASSTVYVVVTYDYTGKIVFDYSHGQYNPSIEFIEEWLISNLTGLGFECVRATGGINETVLTDAVGFLAGSIYGTENAYTSSELNTITDWFNEGNRFMWIGYDSDYAGYQYINDNMTAILEGVGSHVYGEPLSVEDSVSNAGAGYRPIATGVGDDSLVLPAVGGVDSVLMHGPTCLYGSTTGSEGDGIVRLDEEDLDDVYPLLYYGPNATIVDSDLIPGYAHSDGEEGAFVGATLEIGAGYDGSGIIVVSGASPYGDYRPMCTDEYYSEEMTGSRFVLQTIYYSALLTAFDDFLPPVLNHPNDITFNTGQQGNTINWVGESSNPSSYSIYLNGTLYASGVWNSSDETITVDLDALQVGGYNFTIIVNTTLGLEAVDTVMVKVLLPAGIIDQVLLNLNYVITIGSIGVIIVFIILIIRSKSDSASMFDM